MTILDANVLLYAYHAESPHHSAAATWLEKLLTGTDLVGLPWATLWAFIRIGTNLRVWPHSVPTDALWDLSDLLAQPGVTIVHPGPRHAELLERLVTEARPAGPLVSDAALAALAIENGAVLASTDRDFSRFTNLRWIIRYRGFGFATC